MLEKFISKFQVAILMEIYRYSRNNSDCAKLSDLDALIKFKKNNPANIIGSPKKILFTTPYCLYDSNEINNGLSITYYPLWRSRVLPNQNLKFYNNMDKKIDLTNDSEIYRTWPAFGKIGGIPEILVEAQDRVELYCQEEIMNGGAVEQWHQDGVGNYDLPLNIGKIIWIAIQANEGFDTSNESNEENSISVIIRDNNIILNSAHNKKCVTFSAGYEFRGFDLYVKIWAAYWIDLKEYSVRRVLYESIDPIKISLCELHHHVQCLDLPTLCGLQKENAPSAKDNKEKLKSCYSKILLNNSSLAYFQIYDGTNRLIERINNISDCFLFSHSKCVPLL